MKSTLDNKVIQNPKDVSETAVSDTTESKKKPFFSKKKGDGGMLDIEGMVETAEKLNEESTESGLDKVKEEER